MSTKDLRYFRKCPICGDRLEGTDDGVMVFESLQEQIDQGILEPNCTLCGEECPLEEAKTILKKGAPKLNKTTKGANYA
jgi:hypothetical protein